MARRGASVATGPADHPAGISVAPTRQDRAVIVREATENDAATLARLNRVVQGLHHEVHPDRFPAPDETETTPIFRGWLSGADDRAWLPGTSITKAWLCEDGRGEALGYAVGVHRETPGSAFKHPLTWVQLDQIAVRDDARRRGVGQALVSAVEEWAQSLGIETIELSVGEFNRGARRFFATLGFVPLSRQMVRRPRRIRLIPGHR